MVTPGEPAGSQVTDLGGYIWLDVFLAPYVVDNIRETRAER